MLKLQQQLQLEFNEMVESIDTYGGFYIGRYETGNLVATAGTEPVVVKGNSNISNTLLDCFEDEETINYLSWIMAYDFEITELDKCIEDVINSYTKEKTIKRRNEILKQLENKNISREEAEDLEKELNDIIISLAKMK